MMSEEEEVRFTTIGIRVPTKHRFDFLMARLGVWGDTYDTVLNRMLNMVEMLADYFKATRIDEVERKLKKLLEEAVRER